MFPVEAGAQRPGRLGWGGADAGGLRGQNGIVEEAESPRREAELTVEEAVRGKWGGRINRGEIGGSRFGGVGRNRLGRRLGRSRGFGWGGGNSGGGF